MPSLRMSNQTLRLLVTNQKQAAPQRCGMNLPSRNEVEDDNQEKKEVSDHRDAMGDFVNPGHGPAKNTSLCDDHRCEQDEPLVCLGRVPIVKGEVTEAEERDK